MNRHRCPASVERNRWVDIPAPKVGEDWTPSLSLSVVLPYYERSAELARTLAGLTEQTYPSHLFEVIVADDGSPTDPPEIPANVPFECKVVRQEDLGFGAPRARNLGARAADGEVLVFLDCDMIPERNYLEAHSRWHHVSARLVTVGFRKHAEFDHLSVEATANAVRDQTLERVAAGEINRPEWIESHMDRTAELMGPFDDLFRVTSSGNLGVDRELFAEAGGFNESFNRWGGEDNEFGYRLIQLGAVIVPERGALAWHQGEGHEISESERHSLWLQRPKMQHLIADPSFRSPVHGRHYRTPYATLHVDATGRSAELVSLTVDSLLSSDFTDLVVGIDGIGSSDDIYWLRETYDEDPRVVVQVANGLLIQDHPFSVVRMKVPAGVGFSAGSLSALLKSMGGSGYGALHVTIPDQSPAEGMVELRLTRAINRARLIPDEASLDEWVGALFGERWVSGRTHGLWTAEDTEEGVREARQRRHLASSALRSQLESVTAELEATRKELIAVKNRRAMRLADALGSVARAKDIEEARSGIRAVGRSLLWRIQDT